MYYNVLYIVLLIRRTAVVYYDRVKWTHVSLYMYIYLLKCGELELYHSIRTNGV